MRLLRRACLIAGFATAVTACQPMSQIKSGIDDFWGVLFPAAIPPVMEEVVKEELPPLY